MTAVSGPPIVPLSPGRTALGALLIIVATVIGRNLGMLGAGIPLGRIDPSKLEESMGRADGLLLCFGILGASAAGGAVMWAILRKRSPRQYVALERPAPRAIAFGLLASLGLVAFFGAARWFTTGNVLQAGWAETFKSAESLPLLVLALVVVTPLFEEALFRGFVQRGLTASRLGAAGAIGATSVMFALAHFPEDLLGAIDPLTSAIVLGVIRHKTGTITTGIAMHALGNLLVIVMLTGLTAA